LHTTVIGPEGRWVEVQIRTSRMDDIAEKSVAAHWRYKSGEKIKEGTDFYAYIREILEKPDKTGTESDTTREKKELYSDEIFVFTPKGDLKKLKAGYTILDFAYEIHSEIGSSCTGAIVNGVMVPLKHVLNNGDTVKILTSKSQKPKHNWLEFVRSPRVVVRIKHALKMETYKEAEAGKEIVRNKVLQLGLEFNDLITNKLVASFSCENVLDLYQKFGEGKLDPLRIKKVLIEPEPEKEHPLPKKEESFGGRISDVLSGKQDFILIDKDINFIHYQFASCCNPIPGDKIFAFVSVSQGIRIHKTNCNNAKDLVTRYPYRILEARWKEFDAEKSFTAYLIISGNYKDNVLEKISNFITGDLKVSIRSSSIQKDPGNTYTSEIGIYVDTRTHLRDIINRIQKLKEVTSVRQAGN
jgi:GTP pyrophosphokinase